MESTASALCAVIDATTIVYRSHGDSDTAVAVPNTPPLVLDHAEDRVAVTKLSPGATVLMCTGPIGSAVNALDGCETQSTEQLADAVGTRLFGSGERGVALVLYRHPPEPLRITLPAVASSLAVSRGACAGGWPQPTSTPSPARIWCSPSVRPRPTRPSTPSSVWTAA